MLEGLLPIGSVVLLKESTKRVMIMGVCQRSTDNNETIWDYCGCFYPEGYLGSDKIFLFNNAQIDRIYKELGIISSERAAASKDGKYGYLDEDMEPVGKFTWSELTGIKGSTGAGKKDGKWVLVNKKGEAKGDQKYHDVIKDENGFCSNQKCIFVKDKKGYHLISSKEKRIGKLNFDDAKAFTENGYAAVCRDGKWGFVDSDGELIR